MATDTPDTQESKNRLFKELDGLRAGMLGVEGSGQHMQPMSHHVDSETESLWFITSTQTDLVRAVGQGATAHFCLTGTDQDFYACLSGAITQEQDEAKLDELWSVMAAAWFDGGREDADVTLLKLVLREAAIWTADDNAFRFGLEIAKATLQEDTTPDLGTHSVIEFNRGF